MTFFVEKDNSLYVTTSAQLLTDVEEANHFSWAKDHVTDNAAYRWIVAKYVEADRANQNGQYWTFEDLVEARQTITNSPMNLLHHRKQVVGTWVANEMIYPLDEAGEETGHPYIEVLGALWRYPFPDESAAIEDFYSQGQLFVSMECVCDTITFKADGKEETYDYVGPSHPSYGNIQKASGVIKQLNKPHFLGGALVFPPTNPGWKGAHVTNMAKDNSETMSAAAVAYPHLNEKEIRNLVLSIVSDEDAVEEPSAETSKLITEDNVPMVNTDISSSENPQGGANIMEEKDIQVKIDEATASLQARIDELESAASASEADARLTELTESHTAALNEVKAELDAAVLKAEHAETKLAEMVAFLESEAQAAVEAAELAERQEARVARVKEVASFSADHIEKRASEWASLSEEAFDTLIADFEAVASKSSSDDEDDDILPAETAMQASQEDSNKSARDGFYALLKGDRNSIKSIR